MADPVGTTPFKYVTVEQDDDELVIEAGLRDPDAFGEEVRESDAEPAPPRDLQTSAAACEQAAIGESQADTGKDSSEGKPAKGAEDACRGTTLDDLEQEPMPKMQRAVLLGIAILVVVFIAYVLFF